MVSFDLPEANVDIPFDIESLPTNFRIIGKWSRPLTHLNLSPEEREEWLEELLSGTQEAITTAVGDSDLLSTLSVDTHLDQIGPHAEALDIAVSFVSGVASSLAADIVKNYGKKGAIAFAAEVKRALRRREKCNSGQKYYLEPVLSPEFLVLIALEEIGGRLYQDGKPTVSHSRVDRDKRPPFMRHDQLYRIDFRTSGNRATCWITDKGAFHRIEFNGYPQQTYLNHGFLSDDDNYPSQDGIDRSDHIAVIARLSLEYDQYVPATGMDINSLSLELGSILEDETRAALRDMRIHGSESVLSSAPYQVGPAAGGIVDLGHHVVTLLQHSDQLTSYLDDVPTYYFYYRMLVEGRKRIKRRISAREIPGISVIFVNTEAELRALGALYVKVKLDQEPTDEPMIECLTEEFYAGYQSPAHPTENLEYLVTVPVSTGKFQLRVLGSGHIKSLTFNDGDYTQDLDALDSLDDLEWRDAPHQPQ